ncbi:hypothetical protein FRB95_011551 [Tulasnella sp. JGI-2019a]|nr:hypothetical protein FRB95_011551 [Tulasnella sp. JGI-2019a]
MQTAAPSLSVMDATPSPLLESINAESPTTCSLEASIEETGPTQTHGMTDHIPYCAPLNATFPPISQLPVEVFTHILCQSVTVHSWPTVPNWSITRLQELAQVAKAWQNIVLRTPELWGVIKVYRRPSANPRWREDLNLVLARSRSAPLAVAYGVDTEESDDEESDDEDEIDCLREVEEIFTRLSNHTARLRTVLYDGPLSPVVAAVLELPTPSLHYFDVHSHSWRHSNPSEANWSTPPLHLSSGGNLFYVGVKNVPLTWSDFKGLTSLRLVEVQVEMENGRLVEDLLTVLRSCPDLEVLDLEDMGSDREASVESIRHTLARSQPIELPRLWFLKLRKLAPALVLAIALGLRATTVAVLYLHVGPYFLTALPHIDVQQLIKPAFDRALEHSPQSRLYIVQHSHSLRIQNHGSWETPTHRKASFRLHILVEGDTEGNVLDNLYQFLQCSSHPMPVQLEIGLPHSASGNACCIARFPTHILDQVVELRSHGHPMNEVLLYLSQTETQEGSNNEQPWPCPRLASLWILYRRWKYIISFLERRYGPRFAADGTCMTPERLPSITFGHKPPPDILPRIEPFVKELKFIELSS